MLQSSTQKKKKKKITSEAPDGSDINRTDNTK
jgi:hypothetical protein